MNLNLNLMTRKLSALALSWLFVGVATTVSSDAGAAEKPKPKPAKQPSQATLERPKKGLSLGKVAEGQRDPVRERLDEAIRLSKQGDYASAGVALYEFVKSEKKYQDEAEYNLAKALYRLGLYHSALSRFTTLLSPGPQGRFYQASLEWCLFVSRKILADDRVHETIARYAVADFPKEYKDEFTFSLARFHFARGLAIESGGMAGALGETRTEETVTGGKSFQGDIFGDETGAETPGESGAAVKSKEGGGVSIDEDIFGDEEGDKSKAKKTPEEKKSDAKKRGHKKGSRKGDADSRSAASEKSSEKVPDKVPEKKPDPPAQKPETDPKDKKAATVDKLVLTAKEHFETASRLVLRVDAASRVGAKAKFLEALVLYKQGRENDALEAFKTVVRLTRPDQPGRDEALRELAFFQLARTHFGAKQPSYSIFYYDKVDRDSYGWLDAIYEGSWAEFRLGNYEKALGNLLTLHSPFFREEYYPESLILKAVAYYENCRYPEAKSILTEFLKRYEPVYDELKKLTARDQAPAKYYEILANLRSGSDLPDSESRKAVILSQILSLALSDAELKHLDASFLEVAGELNAMKEKGATFATSRLVSTLGTELGAVRDDLAREAGRAVKRKLEEERDAIKTLIQQAVRIDIETSRSEQERIESTLRNIETEPAKREKEFVEWTDDEHSVWPFSGEYWRDELGTYQLTLAHSCR